jgi:hypothetical protein
MGFQIKFYLLKGGDNVKITKYHVLGFVIAGIITILPDFKSR